MRELDLSLGPSGGGGRAVVRAELHLPAGSGPFPVFLTQWNHRAWAALAVRRGYLGCVYAAAAARDDTEPLAALYPECDWGMLLRRAWVASRCVDALGAVPEADGGRIAIVGHSRNGKQSLIAAALDAHFGRAPLDARTVPAAGEARFLYPVGWEGWRARSGEGEGVPAGAPLRWVTGRRLRRLRRRLRRR